MNLALGTQILHPGMLLYACGLVGLLTAVSIETEPSRFRPTDLLAPSSGQQFQLCPVNGPRTDNAAVAASRW